MHRIQSQGLGHQATDSGGLVDFSCDIGYLGFRVEGSGFGVWALRNI